MNLSAMKKFKSATGKDLWFTLVSFLECYVENSDKEPLSLMRALYDCVDFELASHALHVLAQEEDKFIELEQIQDAMFRVGWRPVEEDENNFTQPFPLVLVALATDIDKEFSEAITLKKKGLAGCQSESK